MTMLGNPVGTLGVAYESYNIGVPGALSFIFENGNYDGFSLDEQIQFLEEVGFDSIVASYQFRCVVRLMTDFRNGVFNSAFKEPTCFTPKRRE
jgi:hypothetical protein